MFDTVPLQSKAALCEERNYFEKLGSRTSLIVTPSGLALVALYSADVYTGSVLLTMVGI